MAEAPIWILFRVPTPTRTRGESARGLHDKRATRITDAMRDSARAHGRTFHRCWHATDGSAFYAAACWQTPDGANAFFEEWEIDDEEGEQAIRLDGDLGLVPLG